MRLHLWASGVWGRNCHSGTGEDGGLRQRRLRRMCIRIIEFADYLSQTATKPDYLCTCLKLPLQDTYVSGLTIQCKWRATLDDLCQTLAII